MHFRIARTIIVALVLGSAALGCGPAEEPYVGKPAVSGKKASLPAVPTLPQKVKKNGDAYTIWGVTHDLRSRVHHDDVNGKNISLVGYIVKTTTPSPSARSTRRARRIRRTARRPFRPSRSRTRKARRRTSST